MAVEDHYAAAGVTLPQRRLITPGLPRQAAWDCAALIVGLNAIRTGQHPAARPGVVQQVSGAPYSAVGVRHAVFAVQVVRCIPTVDSRGAPSPAAITAAGVEALTDAGLLSQALVQAVSVLSTMVPAGAAVEAGGIETLGPEGGYAAVEGSITVTCGELI
jgi:hypothetical protein